MTIFWALALASVFLPLQAQNRQDSLPLKHFEVIRVNPDDVRRLPPSVREIFSDPVPDGEPVDNLDAAKKKAGFTPTVLPSKPVTQFVFINSTNVEIKINVAELTAALQAANVRDVAVPQAWNGVVINLRQNPGILTDYGDFFIAQAPSQTMNTPAGFPLAQFVEVILRIAGIKDAEARTLRQRFSSSPTSFFPIESRYEMDNRQVPLASGSGLLLQNAEKGGELALMWNSGDRSYFLSGQLSEAQAIAVANGLR